MQAPISSFGEAQSGEAAANLYEKDRSLSRVEGGNPAWITHCCELFGQQRIAGVEPTTLGCQPMLYPLSYIQVGAEGSDIRRHAVLQRSRASEAF